MGQPDDVTSLYPPCYNFFVSFWIDQKQDAKKEASESTKYSSTYSHEELVALCSRVIGATLITSIELTDVYVESDSKRTSHCYQISLRSDRFALSHDNVSSFEAKLREALCELVTARGP